MALVSASWVQHKGSVAKTNAVIILGWWAEGETSETGLQVTFFHHCVFDFDACADSGVPGLAVKG